MHPLNSLVSAFRSGARILCLAVTELKFKPLMMSILNSSVTINRAISKTSVCYGCLSYQDNAKCKQQIVDYINSNLVRATNCLFVLCVLRNFSSPTFAPF